MPLKRPPRDVWLALREAVWNRDHRSCVRCGQRIALNRCHIDHIVSGKRGTNKFSNLRTLCRPCHELRADPRHRGMTAGALRDGTIPPNWRELVWEE